VTSASLISRTPRAGFRSAVLAGHVQPRLSKIRPAPEHQADTALLPAVADYGIAVQEPDGMPMPYPALSPGQAPVDLSRKDIAYVLVARFPLFVVLQNCRVHIGLIRLAGFPAFMFACS